MDNSLGIIYGLIALFCFGLSNAISQHPTRKIGPLRVYLFRNIGTSILLFLAVLPSLFRLDIEVRYLVFAILLSALGFVPLYSFLKAIEVGKIGLVGPIAYTSSVFTILLSVIFYHEPITLARLIIFVIIIAGVILASLNLRDFKKSNLFDKKSGVPFAIIASLGWGLYFFLNKIPVMHLGTTLTAFIVEFGALIIVLLLHKRQKLNISIPTKPLLGQIFLVSLLGSIAVVVLNIGITVSNVSLVSTISSATPLIVLAYGKFINKDELSRLQYFAIGLILVGIVGLSYF